MSVRKIRNAWWIDFRCNNVRFRKKCPVNSASGAKAYELLVRNKLAHGESLEVKQVAVPTFKDFSEQWYRTYVLTNNKPSEQKAKQVNLRAHLVPFFGNYRLDDLSTLQIEEYKTAKVQSGLAPKTINNHLVTLGKCLRTAQEWLELERIPKIKPLRVPPQKFDHLSRAESEQLLVSIRDRGWYAMALTALRTGLRLGELTGLRWSDIDLEKKLLVVRRSIVRGIVSTPKNNRERIVPLTNQVCNTLKEYRRPGEVVFWRRLGRYMKSDTAWVALQVICRKAGLRPIGWHTFRHTFASQLVASGVPLSIVQELLGHSDIRMTMRYTHMAPSFLSGAVQLLDMPDQKFGHPAVNAELLEIKNEPS